MTDEDPLALVGTHYRNGEQDPALFSPLLSFWRCFVALISVPSQGPFRGSAAQVTHIGPGNWHLEIEHNPLNNSIAPSHLTEQ